jgi:hypothetical protein
VAGAIVALVVGGLAYRKVRQHRVAKALSLGTLSTSVTS